MSTVVGPLLGGFFVDNLSWRWIFYVNLPIGAIALVGDRRGLPRSREAQVAHPIDYLGAVVLAGGLAALVLLTSLGGNDLRVGLAGDHRRWSSPAVVAARRLPLRRAARRGADPAAGAVPQSRLRGRGAVGFIVGLALFGSITYLPLYLQIVKGHSPTELRAAADAADGRPAGHLDRRAGS